MKSKSVFKIFLLIIIPSIFYTCEVDDVVPVKQINFERISAKSDEVYSLEFGDNSFVFKDKIWNVGGKSNSKCWSSGDGSFWIKESNNSLLARDASKAVAFKDKIWITGGKYEYSKGYSKSIIASSDGKNWQEAVEESLFEPRFHHTSIVFDDKLWIIGGYTDIEPYHFVNDIWSTKNGTEWQLVTDSANFSPRMGHTSVVFDNKMWVIGGFDITLEIKNDVWCSEDGVNWQEVTGQAAFPVRYNHSTVVYNDLIWVISGREWNDKYSDVWYSADGINWDEAEVTGDFYPPIRHSSLIFNEKFWLFSFDSSSEFTGSL